jgi:hypothetical protein
MADSSRNTKSEAGNATPAKRPYEPPQLLAVGNLRDLAQGVGGSRADKGQHNNTKFGVG